MPPGGYHGAFLRADLSRGRFESLTIPDGVLRRVVGGSGLGTWLLMDSTATGCEPLAPDSAIVVALSPLVGSPLTTSAKFAVVAKSPLTGRICDALASDRFAIELKRTGVDAVVVTGVCAEWSVLVVDDDGARLESAADLVGLSAADAEARVRERLGDGYRFFGIGPAGESLVRFATISGDGRHAGRGGLGAVFGSKRLKGIAVRGSRAAPLADAPAVLALAKDLSKRSLGTGTAKYRELGTIANVLVMNRLSALPTRNFQRGSFDGAEEVSGEAFHAESPSVRKYCAACTIGCEHVFHLSSQDGSVDGRGVRLEYEGLFALGPLCGVSDREVILRAAALCDDLGIDVISAGGTIAFVMECAERGLLTGEPLLADAPHFGDGEGMLRLLDQIGRREGAGDLLAEGSKRLSERLGGEALGLAAHVKGLELPGYEPRALQTMALGLAVSSRGADHNRSGAYENDLRTGSDRFAAGEDKGAAAVRSEVSAAVMDSLIVCKFLRGAFTDLMEEGAAMLSAVTGWDMDAEELRRVGERVVTLKKLYNVREGWTVAEDTLPDRFLTEPLDGAVRADGTAVTLSRAGLARMIASYYRAHGWTDEGAVPAERVEELALSDLFPTS